MCILQKGQWKGSCSLSRIAGSTTLTMIWFRSRSNFEATWRLVYLASFQWETIWMVCRLAMYLSDLLFCLYSFWFFYFSIFVGCAEITFWMKKTGDIICSRCAVVISVSSVWYNCHQITRENTLRPVSNSVLHHCNYDCDSWCTTFNICFCGLTNINTETLFWSGFLLSIHFFTQAYIDCC